MSLFSTVLRIHEAIYVRSGGAIGHRLLGVPTLLLHTTGRRSGQPRVNGLVYARDGERWIVVPSNGGSDRPPGWLHNIKAQPAVEVQVGRTRTPARAAVIERGDPDFDRLWKLANENNGDRYDAYQRATERPIPLVALEPAA
jgi:deazaflavin-dependent oxidoreductase (nitroreductase family)